MADTFAATYVTATSIKAGEAAARLAANIYRAVNHMNEFVAL